MKRRVVPGNEGELEISDFRLIEAKTRGFLAKVVTITVLTILVLVAVYAATNGKDQMLTAIVSSMTTLMAFVLGYYFKNRDG